MLPRKMSQTCSECGDETDNFYIYEIGADRLAVCEKCDQLYQEESSQQLEKEEES